MSTDFYDICDHCVARAVHYHRKSDEPIAHRWFDGKETVLEIYAGEDDLHRLVLDEYGHVTTLGAAGNNRSARKD